MRTVLVILAIVFLILSVGSLVWWDWALIMPRQKSFTGPFESYGYLVLAWLCAGAAIMKR